MNVGGAETMLMKLYRQMDREKYQMDFALMSDGRGFYESEIESLGGKIYHLPYKSKNPIRCFTQLKATVKENKYEYVMRSGDNAASVIDLIAAKKGGATALIFNSTNSRTYSESKKEKFAHSLFKSTIKKVPTLKIGCSVAANDFIFGNGSVQRGDSIVFHNALRIPDFLFSEEWRREIRGKLGIPLDAFVIGNVGRYNRQKNHSYLLDVFKLVMEKRPNSYLVLFGEGELRAALEKQANLLGITDRVILTGIRNDINHCLSALDVFAFPSLYEGLPNAVVEAEASGLPCILSNTITEEVKLTDNVSFLPIDKESRERWANEITSTSNKRNANAYNDLKRAGYDIEDVTVSLTKLIFNE